MADDPSADSPDSGAPPSASASGTSGSTMSKPSGSKVSGSGSKVSGSGSKSGSKMSGSGSNVSGSGVKSSKSGSQVKSSKSGSGSKLPSNTSSSAAVSSSSAQESTSQAVPAPSEGGGASVNESTSVANSVGSPASETPASATPVSSAQETPESSASPAGRKKHRKKGDLDLQQARIGFLGAGKMTESIVEGLIKFANIPPKHIFIAAPSKKNLTAFKEKGCHVSRRLLDIFARYDCDVVFFCFHGSVIKKCYKQGGNERPFPITTNYIPNNRHPLYFLSLVSGVSLGQLRKCLLNPEHPHKYILEMHRIMVNTAVAQGVGICGIDCDPDSNRLTPPIRTLLGSFAKLEYVAEDQMDAACAIGGSGLAFSYYFINALADGAFKCGLARPLALKLAAKTALCAAKSLLESSRHPSEMRDEVTAPGGSAVFGIHILDKAEVASGVTAAVEAAHKRAIAMAREG